MKLQLSLCSILFIFSMIYMCSEQSHGGIAGSAHDFSTGGDSGSSCIFCHTPHRALAGTPLWNHRLSNAVYQIYSSSSLNANVGQPTGSSKLCLSCHDGTVALGDTLQSGNMLSTFMPPGAANLGTDLSDDHPISFVYSNYIATEDPQIRPPASLPDKLVLDRGEELQCITCHDPHDNSFGKFLVMANERSSLCISCHDLTGWKDSVHESDISSVVEANDDFLRNSMYHTVADNGCLSCHWPHSAGGHQRLLHFKKEEDNCLNCHDGAVASNVLEELNKPSGHDVRRYEEIHDLKELADVSERHVECVDCHNPHAITGESGQSPLVSGAMKQVTGITAEGNVIMPAIHEYEVCFKCHGSNPNRIDSQISRQITQSNTMLEFESTNPSFHPVIAPGVNPDVPSLKPGMDETAIISCIDCHNSEPGSQIKGPHGSEFSPLLAYRYETTDFTQENEEAYKLCYQCHDRNIILGDDRTEKIHKKHLEDDIPCSACHDPHGINSAQGTNANNSHLINFDVSIVFPDTKTGLLEFEDLGDFKGQCFLNCHGEKHSPKSY